MKMLYKYPINSPSIPHVTLNGVIALDPNG